MIDGAVDEETVRLITVEELQPLGAVKLTV
jgi:hypothetical protein